MNWKVILTLILTMFLASCASTESSVTESNKAEQPIKEVVQEKTTEPDALNAKNYSAKKSESGLQDPVTATKSSPLWLENPAPAQKLSDFGQFELKSLTMDEKFTGNDGNLAAQESVQSHINSSVLPKLESWNKGSGKTLIIEPKIAQLRFVGGTARFWGGALAGNSRILLSVKLIDKETGTVIANPVFYQRANGYAGAWSFGAHDRSMLSRVVTKMIEYLEANSTQAVGGKTGRS